MKNLIYTLFILCLFNSCNEDILDENPKSISSKTFYNTAEEVISALNATYAPLQSGDFVSYFTLLAPSADNVYGKGSIGNISDYEGYNTANITNMGKVWTALYKSILNANVVVKNTPSSKEITEEQKSSFIAEAKFVRALDYFFLVRLWGGVPLRTEGNMDEIDLERSSLSDVYDLILDDLQYAEEFLPDSPRLLGTPSKWTAKTVLADVFLNREDWENAMDKSEEVITSGKYSLVPIAEVADFQNIYGSDLLNSTEEIFYFKYNDQRGWDLMNFFHKSDSGYKPYGANYYAFYSKTDNFFYQNWDDADLRKQNNYYNWDIGLGDNTLLFKKFIDINGTSNASNDWPIYRYPEVLLIYAEASNNVNNGPTTKAVEYLNKIRRRAYGFDLDTDSPIDFKVEDYNRNSFFELVLRERGYEMLVECKRWLDLVRTKKATEIIMESEGIALNESMLLWPIPLVEYTFNKAIDPEKDQNPGY